MIKIVAKMTVKEGRQKEFIAAVREMVEKSSAEEGNVFYTLNADRANERRFAIIECWKDQAAIEAHNASEHFRTLRPGYASLCEGPAQLEIYDEIEY